jgi:hypothetical protein
LGFTNGVEWKSELRREVLELEETAVTTLKKLAMTKHEFVCEG